MWSDFSGKAFTREGFAARIKALAWSKWKPIGIVLHNTAAPTLAQWAEQGAAHGARIRNLQSYYEGMGWHGGPHWFISRNWINEFSNPLRQGTHSPSFNKTHFGIEMVGDYDREPFNTGDGALVRDNAVFVMAVLCREFGWDPAKVLKLHKEDPKTTHACPGKLVNKDEVITLVKYEMARQAGLPTPVPDPEPEPGTNTATGDPRQVISKGSTNEPAIRLLQGLLGIPSDGDFGPKTDAAVREFQKAKGLAIDGVVGKATWAALEAGGVPSPSPPQNNEPAPTPTQPAQPAGTLDLARISDIAAKSWISGYAWPGRGKAPIGYTKGVACSFAGALADYRAGYGPMKAIGAATSGNAAKDALAHYAAGFASLGMKNNVDGEDTLRHVFVLLLGLGMRESSGSFCEGRDITAPNVSGSTAEAGAWQMSFDARRGVPLLSQLMSEYDGGGFLSIYREGVTCKATGLRNWGIGPGLDFQVLAKSKPDFAALACALGMRSLRTHWGPINRREVTLRSEADEMFREVAKVVP